MTFADLISNLPDSKTDLSVWEMQMASYFNVPEELLMDCLFRHLPPTVKTVGDFHKELRSGRMTEALIRQWLKDDGLVG